VSSTVARPEHAGPLFDALFPSAHDPHVNVFVEGNAALADGLRRVGATVDFEILRMGAPLVASVPFDRPDRSGQMKPF
jgi:hypothetical protein